MQKQFWRFLAAGGIAAAANFGSRFLFSLWVSYEWAVVLAYMVGLAVAFPLMRTYVFGASGKPVGPQAIKFLLVNAFALLQTFVVSVALERWILPSIGVVFGAEAWAHLFGIAVPIVTSYLGHRAATFK